MSHGKDDRGDGELLGAWRDGDADAIGILIGRHQTPLLRHARSILSDGGPWEDVVQEVFLRLVQSPPALPVEALRDPALARSQLSAWLHKVTRNACMDALRSESRRKKREHEVAEHSSARVEAGPEEARDTREAVERGLARLPRDQREVLVLRLFAEKSYREIAAITGRKVGTVGWLVSVGMKALADQLTPLLDGGDARAADRAGRSSAVGEPRFGLAQGDL